MPEVKESADKLDEGCGPKSELEFLRTLADILSPDRAGGPDVRRALDAISTKRIFLSGTVRPESGALTKPAQVGGTIFDAGLRESLVIERAQREYEYQQTPEREAERIARFKNFKGSVATWQELEDALDALEQFAKGDSTTGRVCMEVHYERAKDILQRLRGLCGTPTPRSASGPASDELEILLNHFERGVLEHDDGSISREALNGLRDDLRAAYIPRSTSGERERLELLQRDQTIERMACVVEDQIAVDVAHGRLQADSILKRAAAAIRALKTVSAIGRSSDG